MRGFQPFRRLVDGRPDDSGTTISRRISLLTPPVISFSNLAGGVVVAILALFVVPRPHVDDTAAALAVNLGAAGIVGVLGVAFGIRVGFASTRVMRRWLREERRPTAAEQRATLRAPSRIFVLTAFIWLVSMGVFFGLNCIFSVALAVVVAIHVGLGGLTTCAIGYFLTERIMRPAAARALREGAPRRPVVPGIIVRSLLAWLVGTGVPILGLALVAIASLIGRPVTESQLAVTALGLGGTAAVVGLFVTWQAARSAADPVLSVREALTRVEDGDYEAEVPVFDGSEVGLLQAGFNRMAAGLREREQMRDLFGRQVGSDVAQAALERGPDMGGETAHVAVLFTDVVGSTSLAAERPPHEVVEMLNRFFAVVVEVVEYHGGWINKFEGDAALAVFGAPVPIDDPADRALGAARELAKRLEGEVDGLSAGIGVSSGTALAGNVGAEQRFEYTVIGDPVNEAARLTELAKAEDSHVLASATTVEEADAEEAARWELGDEAQLRGRSKATRLAHPKADPSESARSFTVPGHGESADRS